MLEHRTSILRDFIVTSVMSNQKFGLINQNTAPYQPPSNIQSGPYRVTGRIFRYDRGFLFKIT